MLRQQKVEGSASTGGGGRAATDAQAPRAVSRCTEHCAAPAESLDARVVEEGGGERGDAHGEGPTLPFATGGRTGAQLLPSDEGRKGGIGAGCMRASAAASCAFRLCASSTVIDITNAHVYTAPNTQLQAPVAVSCDPDALQRRFSPLSFPNQVWPRSRRTRLVQREITCGLTIGFAQQSRCMPLWLLAPADQVWCLVVLSNSCIALLAHSLPPLIPDFRPRRSCYTSLHHLAQSAQGPARAA